MTWLDRLSSRTILAPMAGVTDKPFRQMVRQFGQHLLFTEMASATSLVYGSDQTQRFIKLADEQMPIAIQLFGSNPEHLQQAAVMAEQAGAVLVDINMGCPVRKLVASNAGAALMKMPYLAEEIIEKVKSAVHIPVSVKMRLGWDDAHINACELAKALENVGVDSVTIHGRTKEQGYSGRADWHQIAAVKQVLSIPVIANGDIVDEKSAKMCLELTKADGLMVGRAALGRPWTLAQIDGLKPAYNVADVALEHFERMLAYYGDKGLYIARKHLAWYATGQSFVAQFRRNVYTETNKDNVKALIKEYLNDCQH